MKNHTKQILTIALIVGFGILTACASSGKSSGNSAENTVTKTVQNQTTAVGNEARETPEKTPVQANSDAPQVKKIERKDLFGSYAHRGKQGETSYEFVLTLKDKNIVLYKSDYTGGTSEKSGVWSFDEKKNLVTVKMALEEEFDEELVMILKPVNGNMEVVKKPADEDPIYGKGTIFKKL